MRLRRSLCARGRSFVVVHITVASLTVAGTSRADDFVLYGMNDIDQPGGPDQIVQLDPLTGAGTALHTFTTAGLNFLESLTYDDREGVLWTTNDGVLYRIDPQTFDITEVGDTGSRDIDGLAVNPINGLLYGITHGGNDLLLIDKFDAAASVINGRVETSARLDDLAFDDSGRLFILTSRALVQVDPLDGSRILKARLQGATSLESLLWWPERGVFLSTADRGRYKDLVTLTLSGQIEFVGESSGFRDIEALAWVPAVTEVAVEARSWGAVKSLFRSPKPRP